MGDMLMKVGGALLRSKLGAALLFMVGGIAAGVAVLYEVVPKESKEVQGAGLALVLLLAAIAAVLGPKAAAKLKAVLTGKGAAVLLAALALALVACVPIEAVEQAQREASITHGHALDPHGELPLVARQLAADSSRAWRAQHRALTGDDVPGVEEWPPLPPELAPVAPPADGAPR